MLVLLSLALFAATADDPDKEAVKPKEKLICRAGERTGSRLGSPRVCKTAVQWEADAESARRTMQFRERRTGM